MKKISILVACMATFISTNVFGQTITASDVSIEAGKTADVTFTITSDAKAALAEFTLTLPAGITIAYDADEEDYVYEMGADMTLKTHSVTVKKKESGAFYVLVMNSSGKEFKAESGDYLTLTLEAEATAASGEATMSDIGLFSVEAVQMNTVTAGSFKVNVGTSDGINSISLSDPNAEIFNLNGQRVKNAQKGVYIVNGKKVAVK